MNKSIKYFALTLLVTLFFVNQEAHAYINPGSGSYLFQTIIGGLLSIVYFFKKIILSFISIFTKEKKNINKDI